MFQFPSLAPFGHPVLPGWGFPIRKSRGQTLVCQLTRAYRRLLRPSSPPNAKASTVCPYLFHTKTFKSLKSTDTIKSYRRHYIYHYSYAQYQRTTPIPGRNAPTNRSLKNRQQLRCLPPCPLIRRFEDGLLKGGDPAAGSPTATLLRLHPNHRQDRRRILPKG